MLCVRQSMMTSNEDRATYELERVVYPTVDKEIRSNSSRMKPCQSEEYDLDQQANIHGDGADDRMGAEIRAYCKQYIHLAIDKIVVGISRNGGVSGSLVARRRGRHGNSSKLALRKLKSPPLSGKGGQLSRNETNNRIITPQGLDLSETVVIGHTHRWGSLSNQVSRSLENQVEENTSHHPLVLSEVPVNAEAGTSLLHIERTPYEEELRKITRTFEHDMEVERDFYRQLLCQKEETIKQMKIQIETLKGMIHHPSSRSECSNQRIGSLLGDPSVHMDKDITEACGPVNIGAAEVASTVQDFGLKLLSPEEGDSCPSVGAPMTDDCVPVRRNNPLYEPTERRSYISFFFPGSTIG